MIVDQQEEFTRDWDWYALDQDGHLGHFTTAGLRALPISVKQDREAAESLTEYFFRVAPVQGNFSVRPEAETDCGGWKKQGRERYLRDFVFMASKGLFSFDTEVNHGDNTRYFLVVAPKRPLRLSELPSTIQLVVSRTFAQLRLVDSTYIASRETESW